MDTFLKRCWACISIDNIKHNLAIIRSQLDNKCKIMAVVKANAYGHGDTVLQNYLQNFGVDWFAVSNIEEAITLRKSGAKLPILILGMTPCQYAAELNEYRITQSVFSASYAERLHSEAKAAGVKVDVHVKIDSGMSRIGFSADGNINKSLDDIEHIYKSDSLHCTGIFTHFACSDECKDDSRLYTKTQYEQFMNICNQLQAREIDIGLRHCCNSAAIFNYPDMHLDMVRPGIILYGLSPSNDTKDLNGLKPVMSLHAQIAMIKTIKKGTPVSYGRKFIAQRDTKLATVTCGYADGYPRILSNQSYMLINGHKAPVVGRVCMDQLLLDITDIPNVKEQDTAVIVGYSEDEQITFEQLAQLTGSINYELVCNINRRVPRVYMQNDTIDCVVDYLK